MPRRAPSTAFKKGQVGNPNGRPVGSKNKSTKEIETFFQEFYTSDDYKENLKKRILAGEATTIEQMGHYYAWGKPPDNLNVKGSVKTLIAEVIHPVEKAPNLDDNGSD